MSFGDSVSLIKKDIAAIKMIELTLSERKIEETEEE